MTAIRSALFNVYFFTWLGFMLLVMVLFLPLPRIGMMRTVQVWARGMHRGLGVIAGLDDHVVGRDQVPDRPTIYACKHQSTWDTSIFLILFDDPAYVLKKELLSIPLWGWIARKCAAIAVDRTGGASALKAMVRDTRQAIANGRDVIIFPEGTRIAPGQRHPYHPGISALYRQVNAPVVPVALNSGVFWGRRAFLKRAGTITVEFLPAIPRGLDREAFTAELEARIETESDRLCQEGALLLDRAEPDSDR
jgi:1-acyl-sn-glycerol-3-phosphate acyltransferase